MWSGCSTTSCAEKQLYHRTTYLTLAPLPMWRTMVLKAYSWGSFACLLSPSTSSSLLLSSFRLLQCVFYVYTASYTTIFGSAFFWCAPFHVAYFRHLCVLCTSLLVFASRSLLFLLLRLFIVLCYVLSYFEFCIYVLWHCVFFMCVLLHCVWSQFVMCTFCRASFLVCTFFRIAPVVNPSSLQLLA